MPVLALLLIMMAVEFAVVLLFDTAELLPNMGSARDDTIAVAVMRRMYEVFMPKDRC
jgi:hypothetical protein